MSPWWRRREPAHPFEGWPVDESELAEVRAAFVERLQATPAEELSRSPGRPLKDAVVGPSGAQYLCGWKVTEERERPGSVRVLLAVIPYLSTEKLKDRTEAYLRAPGGAWTRAEISEADWSDERGSPLERRAVEIARGELDRVMAFSDDAVRRLEASGRRVWRYHVSPDDLLYEIEMTVEDAEEEAEGGHRVDIKVSLELGRHYWAEEVAVAAFVRTADGRNIGAEVLAYGDLVERGEREPLPDT